MPYLDGLPIATSVSGTDVIAVDQGGTVGLAGTATTRQTTVAALLQLGPGPITGPGSSVDGDIVTFNGTTGRVLKDSGFQASILGSVIPQIASIAALQAATATTAPNSVVYVIGYRTGADGGEGTFWYNASDTTSADNGGTIIVDASGRRWYRERSGIPLMLSWFGGNHAAADCAPALREAMAALPSPGGEIHVAAGTLTFGSNVAFTYPTGAFSVTLTGEGADNTVLLWAANGGITLNASNFKHSVHIRDITIRAGSAPTGTGLTLNQSQPGGDFGQSDIVRVTFDGITGGTSSFNWAIQVFGWCNINYDAVLIYSASAGGVNLTGALSTSFKYSIIHNMDRCGFFQCATGVQYGSYAQGLTISQTNFVNGATGILVPPGATGALSQLQVSDCEFTLTGQSINIQAAIGEVQIHDNLIIVADNFIGIVVNAAVSWSTFNGNVFVTNSLDANTAGIAASSTSAINIITGNIFEGLSTGVSLGASTQLWNVQSNIYHDCTTNIVNSGSGNTIGGGST